MMTQSDPQASPSQRFDTAYQELLGAVERDPRAASLAVEELGSELSGSLDARRRTLLLRLRGHCLLRAGNFRDAAATYQDAFHAFKSHGLREDAGRTAIAWVDALALSGKTSEARLVAVRGRRWIPRDDLRARAHLESNLGNAYHNAFDYRRARQHFRRALALLRRARAPLLMCAHNLGTVEVRLGRLGHARTWFLAAQRDFKLHGMDAWLLYPEIGLASVDLAAGRWQDGLRRLDAVESKLVQLQDQRLAAYVERERAEILGALGARPSALRSCERAYRLFAEVGAPHDAANTAWTLGQMYAHGSRLPDAVAFLEEARRYWEETGNRRAEARSQMELLGLELASGRVAGVADSLRKLQRHLDLWDSTTLGAKCLALRASARLEEQHFDRAIELARRSRRRARRGWVRAERPRLAVLIAGAYQQAGDRPRALSWVRRAVTEVETELDQFGTSPWSEDAAAARDLIYEPAIEILLAHPTPRSIASAADLLSRAHSSAILDSILARASTPEAKGLRVALNRIRGRMMSEPDADVGTRGLRIEREVTQLGRRLRQVLATPRPRSEPSEARRRLEAWRSRLNEDCAVVMYQRSARGARAFVVDGRSVRCVELPHATNALDRHWRSVRLVVEILTGANQARRRILVDRTYREATTALHGLREALWDPLELPSARIAVVPDGDLHGVPLESLSTLAGAPVAVCRISHPGQLFAPRPSAVSRSESLLLHGNTPGARREARRVAHALRRSGARTRTSSRASLLRGEGPLSVLHVAAHGVVHPGQPYLSGLALDQQWLGAEHLTPSRLGGSLVFLASCRSGYTHVRPGRRAHGWHTAAVAAGAAQVVLSLWRVDDQSATAFADRFYEKWPMHRDAAQAASVSRLRMLEEGYHPYAWAGFQITDRTGFGPDEIPISSPPTSLSSGGELS